MLALYTFLNRRALHHAGPPFSVWGDQADPLLWVSQSAKGHASVVRILE